tara:strand:- start:3222 stop:3530 length:309 start_codon:yes stop_codon:yes gene_type:complete
MTLNIEEEDFYKYDYIVIDKTDDILYFKDTAEICKYFDLTRSKVYSIVIQSKKKYIYRSKSGLFIQRLYNNTLARQPEDTTFIWDYGNRKKYNKEKYNSPYK